jgi:hypothetical protein
MAVDDAMWEGCLRNMVDDDDSIPFEHCDQKRLVLVRLTSTASTWAGKMNT